MAVQEELRATVEAWIDDDPDERDREEMRALLDRAAGDDRAAAELRDRFAGRLAFGTAGLRGAIGAGPNRMNRAVVRAATAAVAGWLTDTMDAAAGPAGAGTIPNSARAAVVVGCDARHRSAEFAAEVARVLAGAGIRVLSLPRPGPTPLLAFAVRRLAASAGIMITASHNPAEDNGYKLYLSDGAQVIPPVDAEIESRIARRRGAGGATAPGGRLHAAAQGRGRPHAARHGASRLRRTARGGGTGRPGPGLPDGLVPQSRGARCTRPGTRGRSTPRRGPGAGQRSGRGPARGGLAYCSRCRCHASRPWRPARPECPARPGCPGRPQRPCR